MSITITQLVVSMLAREKAEVDALYARALGS
jgi:hypothetical protein